MASIVIGLKKYYHLWPFQSTIDEAVRLCNIVEFYDLGNFSYNLFHRPPGAIFKGFAIFHRPKHTQGLWKIAKKDIPIVKFGCGSDCIKV